MQIRRNVADKDTQLELKKRARRRLVGASALALLAAVVLPLVMDQEPKPLNQDVQIRIPNPDAAGVSLLPPKSATAPSPETAPAVPPTASGAPAAAPAPLVGKPVDKPVDKPVEKVEKAAKPVENPAEQPIKPEAVAEASRAEAILNGAEPSAKAEKAGNKYVVQIGVFSDAANVKRLREKIKGEGYNSLVEPVPTDKGTKSRVKAGPFASKEAAAKAQARLKRIGLDSVVVAKP